MEQRRRADFARNRDRILAAAERVLTADPEAPVAAVAAAAGLSRKSVYAHFPTREDLLVALLDEVCAAMRDALDAADLTRGPEPEAMRRGAAHLHEPGLRLRGLRRAFEPELGAAAVHTRRQAALRGFITLVERGQREGLFRRDLDAPVVEAVAEGLSRAYSDAVDAGHLDARRVPELIHDSMLRLLLPG